MKKIKVFFLKNSRGDYAQFDLCGWDYSNLFIFATKFSNKKEARIARKIAKYVTVCPLNDYKIFSKKVAAK